MVRFNTRMLGACCAAAIATSFSAWAQDDTPTTTPPAGSSDPLVQDNVVVTGSRIPRGNAESAVPLQVIGGEEFGELGTNDLAEVLVEVPGIADGVSQRGSNNNIQTAGLSTVSLRRLGDNRTLVLVDGRRVVSNSGNADRVSLSTIPGGLLERTEVTTGGASAIYGSDAIAGVVNFTLEDDFTGFQIDTSYSTPEASGGDEYEIDLRWGTKFANDRGYFLASGILIDEKEILADSSRPLSILPIEFDDPSTASGNSFANEINTPGCDPNNEDRHCFLPSFSGSVPGGVFEGDAWVTRDGVFVNDQGGLTDRAPGQDFFSDFDGFNFRPGRSLNGSREIINLGMTTSFELTPLATASFSAFYSDVESETKGGFETLNDDDEYNDGAGGVEEVGNIASDNPFIPQIVEDTRSGSVSFDRRLVELGEQSRQNDRETLRLITDLKGGFENGLGYELYATYGHFEQDQTNPNEVNFLNASFALDVEDDGAGGFQCADDDARAAGCVPLNVFGLNSITPEAANYIRYNGFASQSRTQYTAGGFVVGELFTLPAGAVKFVTGAEFRREEQDTEGDPDGDLVGGIDGDPTTPDADVTSLATFPSVSASYEVVEGFAELDVPIIEDLLTLQLAGRVGDYNTIGTIFSYNVGAVLEPIDGLKFRSQYSRSQRAPTITEIFSPPRPDSDDLDGPCDGLNPDGSGLDPLNGNGGAEAGTAILATVAANCLSEPGIQAFFADPDNAGDPFDDDGSVQGPNSGNPNVKEETADTFTAGFVLEPAFLDNFQLIVDYFVIEIDDAIGSLSTQDTVDLCYASTDFPNNRFCDVITRSQSDGSVQEVINFQENVGTEKVEGIDASINYDVEFAAIPGEFDVDLRYSHYFTEERTQIAIGGNDSPLSFLGELENPEDEFRARLGWRNDGLRIAYTLSFEQGGVDDINNHPDPDDDRFFKVGDEYFHRIYVGYDFGADDQYRIYGGIDNITDNFGPLLPTGLNNGSSRNIEGDINDITGREFYVGARLRF